MGYQKRRNLKLSLKRKSSRNRVKKIKRRKNRNPKLSKSLILKRRLLIKRKAEDGNTKSRKSDSKLIILKILNCFKKSCRNTHPRKVPKNQSHNKRRNGYFLSLNK